MQPDDDKTRTCVTLTSGTMVSHYRIIEKIGAGGMGEVYLAEDTKLSRKVALKFLPPHMCQDADCRARFTREAQAAAKLSHPNIVTIYEVSESNGRPFFAMEHVEGQTLRDSSKVKELPLSRIIEFAIQICDGLAKAHSAGIVHRDIKPSNILIDQDGRAKIVDFGLASVCGSEHLTKTGSTLGTVGYMSPEQARGEEVDARSDLFSFGVVLYEMITNRSPFKAESEIATIKNINEAVPEPLARYKNDVPDELQIILSKALIKDKNLRYQHADDLSADLKRLVSMVSSAPRPSKRKRLRLAVFSSVLVVAVAALLILKPWKFVISPTQEAVATGNRLAIMYFDNLADPTDSLRMGEIATNLLITNLFESQYLQVVSSQRLYDILKLLGKEGVKRVDRSVATQIAKEAKANQMLLGSVLQISPEIILTSQIIDVATGNVIASQRITGAVGEAVFPIIDRLSVELKKDLSLPQAALKESTIPTADLTTRSLEAYRYYLEGVEYANQFYNQQAEESFLKALQYDSTFAMAYYYLSMLQTMTGTFSESQRLIARALQYSDKVSQKEKYYIKMQDANISGRPTQAIEYLLKIVDRYPDEKEAFLILGALSYQDLGKTDDAIRYLSRAIELDSLNKRAYNQLALVYDIIGDYEKSLWAINKYISLAPNEANPYDTRGYIYANNGRIDQAIESYRKALEIKPDFLVMSTITKLGDMYLLRRDYARADSCYRQLITDQDKKKRSQGRLLLARIPAHQGKFDHALQVLDDGLAADRIEQSEGQWNADKHLLKALLYEEKNDLNLALREMETYMEIYGRIDPDDKVTGRPPYVRLLALNKEFARATQVAEAVKIAIDTGQIFAYWYMLGCIELAKGNPETSLAAFQKVVKESPVGLGQHYMLARAYLEAGRLGESVTEFEKVLSRYSHQRASLPIWAVKAYYLLGLAYEKSGWNHEAIERYEEFLDIWKDADPGLKDVQDAKARLARLKAKS